MSSAPSAAPSNKNCTPTTPTLSEALAVIEIPPVMIAPLLGAKMLTRGASLSGGGGGRREKLAVTDSA